MPWVRLDEQFAQHPKIKRAGPEGMALHVAALCYCNQYLTDGDLPAEVARTLIDFGSARKAEAIAQRLVEVGLWEPAADGYLIHDYLDYQPSKQTVLQERAKKQAAGKAGGKASAKARASGNRSGAEPTPSPVPSPPVGLDNSSTSSSPGVDGADVTAASLQDHFETEGFDPNDVAVLVTRLRFRSNVTDPFAWMHKALLSMAVTRSADPGEAKVIELEDGSRMELDEHGQWRELSRGEVAS